jgi:predicted nucleotide-binding protein (sugar kinase/HSP70/actin superfamily)
MGNLYIAFKALAKQLDVDFVIPPFNNSRTLSLGVKYSPEGLCIPFKLTLGNMIEAAEMGADTMLMATGYGICRLGCYGRTQEEILRELGYHARVINLGVSEHKLLGMLTMIKSLTQNASWPRIISAFRFSLAKLSIIDKMEKLVQKVRAVETERGTADRIYSRAITAIDGTDDYTSLRETARDYFQQLEQIPKNNGRQPLVVGITGEFYVLLEPFSNQDIERELGKLGVEVRRKTFVSEWTKFSLFLNMLGINEKSRIHRAARPYLKRDIGGDGWESVGEKVLHAGDYDGLIHLAPFTCMPEIIAASIMPHTREKIPVLTLICAEQMGNAGMLTRIEAFTDLLERGRRQGRRALSKC